MNDACPVPAADGRQVVFAGYYLAHWWPRVWATLLDGLILSPVNITLALGFHLFTVTHELDANGTSVHRLETHPFVFLLFALVFVLYTVILTCRAGEHNGQTLGKQKFGLRVIRNDGKPVDIKTALVREGLVKTLPSLIGSVSALLSVATSFFSLLDDLWPIPGQDNQAIHDLAAETHVVQTKQRPVHTPNTFETALASARSAQEPMAVTDAGSKLLREVSIGANVYVALRDIAPDTAGACWIDPAAPVRNAPNDIHVVRVSNAPEGLFVNVPAVYKSLLVSDPSEATSTSRPAGDAQRSAFLRAFLAGLRPVAPRTTV
jgi:uncharacterized RDD family membrane protein YckC